MAHTGPIVSIGDPIQAAWAPGWLPGWLLDRILFSPVFIPDQEAELLQRSFTQWKFDPLSPAYHPTVPRKPKASPKGRALVLSIARYMQ